MNLRKRCRAFVESIGSLPRQVMDLSDVYPVKSVLWTLAALAVSAGLLALYLLQILPLAVLAPISVLALYAQYRAPMWYIESMEFLKLWLAHLILVLIVGSVPAVFVLIIDESALGECFRILTLLLPAALPAMQLGAAFPSLADIIEIALDILD